MYLLLFYVWYLSTKFMASPAFQTHPGRSNHGRRGAAPATQWGGAPVAPGNRAGRPGELACWSSEPAPEKRRPAAAACPLQRQASTRARAHGEARNCCTIASNPCLSRRAGLSPDTPRALVRPPWEVAHLQRSAVLGREPRSLHELMHPSSRSCGFAAHGPQPTIPPRSAPYTKTSVCASQSMKTLSLA